MNAVIERADVIARAKRVGALARKHMKESEELGKLAEPVAEALHSEGLLGMWFIKKFDVTTMYFHGADSAFLGSNTPANQPLPAGARAAFQPAASAR